MSDVDFNSLFFNALHFFFSPERKKASMCVIAQKKDEKKEMKKGIKNEQKRNEIERERKKK